MAGKGSSGGKGGSAGKGGGKIGKEQGHQGGGKLSHMTLAGIDDRSRYLNDQNDVLLGPGLAGKARDGPGTGKKGSHLNVLEH
ncbi:hypothetical protein [Cupriavidus sp. UYPR2.512]|uniref:hypothetical protein n=1 Tax=Cupriavidus sp. UYPR2.512 TaxID=1080187 RepID=UPI00037C513C|nr:hypothetical protein [Cupriavidus sp. UYPR2.512]UIF88024.1 hypothetical protein KAF44_22480 [Cupriavidus necator]